MFKGEKVAQEIPGDVGIVGIRWRGKDASDISFELRVGQWQGTLTCVNATDVKITLDQTGYTGVIPTWACDVTLDEGPWTVNFDLAPVGCVRLGCDDVHLEVLHSGRASGER